jgi:hypothetical protein
MAPSSPTVNTALEGSSASTNAYPNYSAVAGEVYSGTSESPATNGHTGAAPADPFSNHLAPITATAVTSGTPGWSMSSAPSTAPVDPTSHYPGSTPSAYTPMTPAQTNGVDVPNASTTSAAALSAGLPPNWRAATSADGVYYYNIVTGETQWERPVATSPDQGASTSIKSSEATPDARRSGDNTGTTSSHSKRKPADDDRRDKKRLHSLSESESQVMSEKESRLIRELRARVSEVVVKCLSKYRVEFGDVERFKKEAKKVGVISLLFHGQLTGYFYDHIDGGCDGRKGTT